MEQKKCSETELSFDFEIKYFERRLIEVKVVKQNRDFQNMDKEIIFNIFIEDLIYFISSSGIQIKWDVDKIIIQNLDLLKINQEEKIYFLNQFKTVSNWNLKGVL